ncbi:MAG: hypothetical protein V3V28_08620 [Polaribacter sp.]|uniref:hypothetical protein n=1 Tax=Polaribacter sp. TaxID=1920175 RepID=UPI002F34FED3
MALDKATLVTDLKSIFNNADKESNIDAIATQMANAIDRYVKTGNAVGVDSRADTHNLTIQ